MMIRRFFLSLLLLAFIAEFPQTGNAQEFTSSEKQKFFQEYFHSNGTEWCLWKPNQGEQESFPASDDGYCHTKLDTTLYYNSGEGAFAVLIFGTYEFKDGAQTNCSYCFPITSIAVVKKISEGQWKTIIFIKNFLSSASWGLYPPKGIQRFGKHFFVVEEGSFTQPGSIQWYRIYYHLPTLTESLQIGGDYYYTGGLNNKDQLTDWKEEIFDISSERRTIVQVTKKGIAYLGNNKQVQYDLIRKYKFDDFNCKFVQSR